MVTIGIVGDFDAARATHRATSDAIAHAAAALGVQVTASWLATESVSRAGAAMLEQSDALVIAPGSPYRSMAGALRAIRIARESSLPLLATCGGFQHVVVEYARNVLGLADAAHAEYDPGAIRQVVTPLQCALAGQRATVRFAPGSRVRTWYGADEVEEEYRCTFGLNPAYREDLEAGGLRIVGIDRHGEPRVVELPQHPCFVATLYVPQMSSDVRHPHPLLCAFVSAAAEHRGKRT